MRPSRVSHALEEKWGCFTRFIFNLFVSVLVAQSFSLTHTQSVHNSNGGPIWAKRQFCAVRKWKQINIYRTLAQHYLRSLYKVHEVVFVCQSKKGGGGGRDGGKVLVLRRCDEHFRFQRNKTQRRTRPDKKRLLSRFLSDLLLWTTSTTTWHRRRKFDLCLIDRIYKVDAVELHHIFHWLHADANGTATHTDRHTNHSKLRRIGKRNRNAHFDDK